jgi:hypothetical protein
MDPGQPLEVDVGVVCGAADQLDAAQRRLWYPYADGSEPAGEYATTVATSGEVSAIIQRCESSTSSRALGGGAGAS